MPVVYLIESDLTEMCYVGRTKNATIRWKDHKRFAERSSKKTPLYCCMRKHGVENFKMTILETFKDEESTIAGETKWIQRLKTEGRMLLNCDEGGFGGVGRKHSEETRVKLRRSFESRTPEIREKMKEKAREACRTEEFREKIAKKMTGKRLSEETRIKISLKAIAREKAKKEKGTKQMTEKERKNRSDASKRRKHTQETKKKLSEIAALRQAAIKEAKKEKQ